MVEVSVIIPNYNHGKYLKERLDSVFQQTYKDFEVIILDDHSTDNSREIIEEFRNHEKLSGIFYNELNSGSPFKQWNKGMGYAKGRYIWIAESDDSSEPIFLERTVSKMNEYPSLAIACVQNLEHDETGDNHGLSFDGHPRFGQSFQTSYFAKGQDEIASKLVYENTILNASGVLFRKDIYEMVGGPDETMKLCGDWMLWVKMLFWGDLFFIADPLNYFRLTALSARSKYSLKETYIERIKVIQFISNSGIKNTRESEIALFAKLINSFKLTELGKPIRQIRSESGKVPGLNSKIFSALTHVLFRRLKGRLSRK